MRRGLMGWDEDELPLGVLDARLRRLRGAMQANGLDGLILYTNLVRPSAVSYVTGFTPYWSEGILLVGRDGAPAFATALSKRVANWIRTVTPVGEIVTNPQPGAVVGQRIAAAAMRRVGVLELDAFPSGPNDDLCGAAPGCEFVDATVMFAEFRRARDAAELRLVGRADEIAVAALDEADGAGGDAGAIVGAVEKHARLAGAEEAYIAIAPALASDTRMIRAAPGRALTDPFALRASIAYKGHWVRRTRTFVADAALRQRLGRADEWFARLIASLALGQPFDARIAESIAQLSGAELVGWMAESCIGSYPLQVIADAQSPDGYVPNDGDFIVLSLALKLDGQAWLGAAPAMIGGTL